MSVTKRRRQAARRRRWVDALRVRADELLGRGYENVDQYGCRHCGTITASAGPVVTDEDWDREYEWRDEIRRHEAGECRPAGVR